MRMILQLLEGQVWHYLVFSSEVHCREGEKEREKEREREREREREKLDPQVS